MSLLSFSLAIRPDIYDILFIIMYHMEPKTQIFHVSFTSSDFRLTQEIIEKIYCIFGRFTRHSRKYLEKILVENIF